MLSSHTLAHLKYEETSCMACHHELRITHGVTGHAGRQYCSTGRTTVSHCMRCLSRHKLRPNFKEAHQAEYLARGGEQSCISCHHTRLGGLSKAWDHQAHIDDYTSGDCQTCHHTEDMSQNPKPAPTATMPQEVPHPVSPLKWPPTPDAPRATKISLKKSCQAAHICHEFLPVRAATAQDKNSSDFTSCTTCHEQIPSRMDAFHGQCFTCHDTIGKGPGSKASCEQCHTR